MIGTTATVGSSMQSDGIDEPLIAAIYGPALQNGDWSDALDRFRVLLNSNDAALSIWENNGSRHTLNTTGRSLTVDRGQQYETYYGRLDPKMPILAARGIGFLFNDANHFDSTFVARDPFYQEFSAPMGSRHTLDMCLRRNSKVTIYLAAMRGQQPGPYQDSAEALFAQAGTHFLRAIDLKEKFDLAHRVTAAFDGLSAAILVIGADGRMELANRRAVSMIGKGRQLRLCRGKLYARSADLNRRLNASIAGALSGTHPTGVLNFSEADECQMTLWLMPLPETSPLSPKRFPAVLVVISGSECVRLDGPELSALYGLSEAESRLALALVRGATLKTIATQRGVKLSTVRTQLLSVLGKMGLHRQADLTRTLAQLSRPVQDAFEPGGFLD